MQGCCGHSKEVPLWRGLTESLIAARNILRFVEAMSECAVLQYIITEPHCKVKFNVMSMSYPRMRNYCDIRLYIVRFCVIYEIILHASFQCFRTDVEIRAFQYSTVIIATLCTLYCTMPKARHAPAIAKSNVL